MTPDAVGRTEECLASGMLISTQDGVAFRHELARLIIEEGLHRIGASSSTVWP
jgi:hypothetical protein